ncbi:MAG: hypothetical protein GXP61_07395, partial [Epsilonproteobacteria bacterium]|nr:hypothetical protein [Campylobacterota bacterium]
SIFGFFSYVSEDRFIQDYMSFYDAIDKDMRVYDILNVDTWIDKIVPDGIKRYLYVRWEKRYQSTSSNNELSKKGYSRFLFDEVNGKYKLIGLAGNNFWGGSLAEWRDEVPDIAGQEPKILPDLIITKASVFSGNLAVFIKNQGDKDVTSSIKVEDTSTGDSVTYSNGLPAGGTAIVQISNTQAQAGDTVVIDPNNTIQESDETNNNAIAVSFNGQTFD